MRVHPRAASLPDDLRPVDGDLVERALLALGRLDGVATLLPDARLHAWLAVRKEAVLSAHLDGVGEAVALTDVLRHEDEPGPGPAGLPVVAAHASALARGVSELRAGRVLSAQLLGELHGQPLRTAVPTPGGRGAWVPPPPDGLPAALADLERFLREPAPVLVRAAVGLARIENLQPFAEGNGRLGRALIPLLLYGEGVLQAPLVAPSGFFRTHRDAYSLRLRAVRADGDWEGWVRFVHEAVAESADHAVATIRGLLALFASDREAIAAAPHASAALRLYEALLRRPRTTVGRLAHATGLPTGATAEALDTLAQLRIARPEDGLHAYAAYCKVIDEGTAAPIPR